MSYNDLRKHVGHKISLKVQYGHSMDPTVISIFCEDCQTEIMYADEYADAELFEKLGRHISISQKLVELGKEDAHEIYCVSYGIKGESPANIAIECETCAEILVTVDRPNYSG